MSKYYQHGEEIVAQSRAAIVVIDILRGYRRYSASAAEAQYKLPDCSLTTL